jgi:hypothetical protein
LVAANFPNVNDPGGRVIRPRPADYATATRRIAQDLLINYEGGGSSVDPYWDNPALFNRDRPLFRKYVPLIRRINREGWQVVTQARSADPTVFIERFGSWPSLFFTLRNSGDRAVTTRISFDAALGLPAGRLVARPLIAGGPELVAGEGAGRPLPVTLAPQQVELLEIAQ